MGCSTLHIKTEIECRVFLFDEEKGIAKPGSYFNLEVRKGEQDLLFVSTNDETLRCQMLYNVEENDCDYRILLRKVQFIQYSQDFLEKMRLAEQGDADAQLCLARIYYRGAEGVKQDYAESVYWLHKSAEQGLVEAQVDLGYCYVEGIGVNQDYTEAAKWLRKAAELGWNSAQYFLGRCYYNNKDYAEAEKWLRKAVENGYNTARELLVKIESKLDEQKKQINNVTTPYYLFFDTETTGVPRNYNAPASDTKNWPRLVQLGWILTDEKGNILNNGNEIVRPEGYVIPTDASMVHGITTEIALQYGKPLQNVIDAFLNDVKRAQCLVGHNISFDKCVVGAELYRLGLPDIVSKKRSICTMVSSTDFCKIPGYDGYKYPKLQELYRKLFGCDFEDAHDAMADITATKRCFFELERIGVVLYSDSKYYDFGKADVICRFNFCELFEKSEFKNVKCGSNIYGNYIVLLPSITGLEYTAVAYASDGSGRKHDYDKDSLIIYENSEGEFALEFGECEEDDD